MFEFSLIDVSSSESPAFEHCKIWYLKTFCWLSGERPLPIGLLVISSPEPKLKGLDLSRHPPVRPFTLSDMNISKSGLPIIIKFHLEHHWDGGLAALGFGPNQIRTLVSMATYSSHRVIMGEIL